MITTVTRTGVRLIGDEMLAWSDASRGAAQGSVLGALLRGRPYGDRVLMAGPHSRGLMRMLLQRGARLSCLVRSYRDATALADEFSESLTVLCGSLAKLPADEQYDAVVALDGVDRLCSAEGAQLTWAEAVEVLVHAVRPGGELLLGVPNLFGANRLAAMSVSEPNEDSSWSYAGELDVSRPLAPVRLHQALCDLGLRPDRLWAGYPLPTAPTILISDDALDGEVARSGQLSGVLAAACSAGFSGTPVLFDPRRLTTSAVRGGLGIELSPLWVVSARKPTQLHADEASASTSELALPMHVPEILVADGTGRFGVLFEVTMEGGHMWIRRPIGTGPTGTDPAGTALARVGDSDLEQDTVDDTGTAFGVLRRDPTALTGPMPAGQSLAELLLAACARRDLPELRLLLTSWADLAETAPLATADNVVVGDDRLQILDPSWSTVDPVVGQVAVARCLRHFAVTLLSGPYAHPWPSLLDADALAIVLGGLSGRTLDRATLAEAVELEASLQAATRGLSESERLELVVRLAGIAAGTPPPDLDGLRETRATVTTLRRELAHAKAKLGWYEELLTSRERALRRSQRTIDLLSRSVSYRVGRRLITPARWAKRTLRRLLAQVGLLGWARRVRHSVEAARK